MSLPSSASAMFPATPTHQKTGKIKIEMGIAKKVSVCQSTHTTLDSPTQGLGFRVDSFKVKGFGFQGVELVFRV